MAVINSIPDGKLVSGWVSKMRLASALLGLVTGLSKPEISNVWLTAVNDGTANL